MIMALDVGNSQIYGGVFADNEIKLQFRNTSRGHISSDEMGLFLRGVLRENGIDHKRIKQIGICSVVPDAIHSVRGGCQKYFSQTPFILQPGVKTGLKIRYRNPIEVGADRIANSIAASLMFPGKNLIIVDLGTATTFDVVTSDRDYLGGIIVPGLRLSMEALETNTARLPAVEIIAATEIIGRSTVESIQSGLYFGNLFMVRELAREIKLKELKDPNALLIGTGGFSRLFERAQLFDQVIPELVLLGIKNAIELN